MLGYQSERLPHSEIYLIIALRKMFIRRGEKVLQRVTCELHIKTGRERIKLKMISITPPDPNLQVLKFNFFFLNMIHMLEGKHLFGP